MPPVLTWFAGRQAVTDFFALRALDVPGRFRLVPVVANGQQALAIYQRESDGAHHADGLTLVTVTTTGIARIVTFRDPSLFKLFGLPPVYGADATGPASAHDVAGTRWPG
jgi:RNA polymerase sigma-70 factor (ECF subfamily)